VTGNAVSEGSSRAGNSAHSPSSRAQARDLTQADGSHKPTCTIIVRSRGPSPQKGVRDDTRAVLGNGDRVFAFALSSRAKARDLTQARGSHRLAYTRSSSGCLADIPQRLFVHIQNRSVCGKRSDRGDVAAACDHRRSQTAATEPETYRETLQGF
jgi:hypothetical protein